MGTKNILPVLILMLIVFACGISGHRYIEGWSWFDAFYMITITLTRSGIV